MNKLKDHSYVFNEVTDSQECWRQQLLEIDLPQGYLISQPLIRMLARGEGKKAQLKIVLLSAAVVIPESQEWVKKM